MLHPDRLRYRSLHEAALKDKSDGGTAMDRMQK